MTGAYLPAKKWYNVPFVIGTVLLVLGVLTYIDAPVLMWIERADQFLREKTETKKSNTIKNKAFKRTILMKLMKYEIPQEYQNRSDVLVCHYCTWSVGFLIGLIFSFGVGMCIGLLAGTIGGEFYVDDLFGVWLVGVFGILISGASGVYIFKHMKNWTVILHKGGVWYRNIAGEVRNYTDAEVKGYMVASGNDIVLGPEPKRVTIMSFAPNYELALQWIRQKYRKL